MAGLKERRTAARIEGERLATGVVRDLGCRVRDGRRRRRLTQRSLARQVGISRQRLGDIEAGRGGAVPAADWFALAKALGIYLRFEFGRDPQAELRDAGHLDIQQLVARVAAAGGWRADWESRTGGRWTDIRLEDRRRQRIVIVECWNTFGDLGEALRSSDYKVREVADAGLLWVVRDTRANRELVGRYGTLLESRFKGSSLGWVRALVGEGEVPDQSGLVWCDVKARRVFARRR
jgi:transcriptional regulator with XRE-family HTH domain